MAFICPCLRCPLCGNVADDQAHPIDGLASCWAAHHSSRLHLEWWAHAGPYMDGRHPQSQVEVEEWEAYDNDVLARGRDC